MPKKSAPKATTGEKKIVAAVQEIMNEIERRCEPSVMSQSEALEYYDRIIGEIQMRQDALREEMGEED